MYKGVNTHDVEKFTKGQGHDVPYVPLREGYGSEPEPSEMAFVLSSSCLAWPSHTQLQALSLTFLSVPNLVLSILTFVSS